ncbi:RlmF-related methyltransferase [Serratia proteamaculans]
MGFINSAFVKPNAWGDISVDFADPAAVKMLNRALLRNIFMVSNIGISPPIICVRRSQGAPTICTTWPTCWRPATAARYRVVKAWRSST